MNENDKVEDVIVADPEMSQAAESVEEPTISSESPEPADYRLDESRVAKSGSGKVLAFFALLISVAAVAAVGWLYQQSQQPQQAPEQDARIVSLQQKMETVNSAQSQNSQQIRSEMTQLKQQNETLKTSVVELRGKNVEMQATVSSLQDAVSRLALQQMGSTRASQLEEVEYLLRFAGQRAQLFHDLDGAIQALSQADGLLQLINIPDFQPVRTRISTELALLHGIKQPDLVSMSGTLIAYQNQLAQWPFATTEKQQQESQQEQTRSTETGWWDKSTRAMRGLVTIRRTGEQPTVLRKPEAQSLLQENMRLKLESARLALIERNQALFRQNIDLISSWLNLYYNSEDSQVQAAIESLQEFNKIELLPSAGDVAGALQVYLATRAQLTLEDPS